MKYEINQLDWHDSVLEKVEIAHDRIVLTINTDTSLKAVKIICEGCAGISRFITWDEVIIYNIDYSPAATASNEIIQKVISIYGEDDKPLAKSRSLPFNELKVQLVDISFSVVCQQAWAETEN